MPPCRPATGGRWADLGSGRGVFSGALAHLLGPEGTVLALDIERGPLKQMQRLAKPTEWRHRLFQLQADIRQPLPFRELDGLLAANVLHFIPDEKKPVLLRQLLFGVRPGGTIIIVEYNHGRSTWAVPHPRSASGWLDLLKDSGWDKPRICARTPSSYLGEMVALKGVRPG